ncbi:hypothetical protein KO561_18420 [Radiobacillus kanasensis]|uniref:hypothetical protein n=1 Tax=Radiobacillus kanasensis TaxID=2844358 RepID=UPI001E5ABF82|nr:hypothetical protein [Radiobacillus kanasensis]UFT99127.1 hypothetical protein KO561_18420 [Radiobacillus kanasensis]
MSETVIQNQIFLALVAYCFTVLIQLEMKSNKSLLRISRWLKRTLWEPAYVWTPKDWITLEKAEQIAGNLICNPESKAPSASSELFLINGFKTKGSARVRIQLVEL